MGTLYTHTYIHTYVHIHTHKLFVRMCVSREHWIGGFTESGTDKEVDSSTMLEQAMQQRGFSKIYEEPMPLVIREHSV